MSEEKGYKHTQRLGLGVIVSVEKGSTRHGASVSVAADAGVRANSTHIASISSCTARDECAAISELFVRLRSAATEDAFD